MVVGPTKVQPRFLRSFERAIDSGVVLIRRSVAQVSRRGREAGSGSKRQKKATREPTSSRSSQARRAGRASRRAGRRRRSGTPTLRRGSGGTPARRLPTRSEASGRARRGARAWALPDEELLPQRLQRVDDAGVRKD